MNFILGIAIGWITMGIGFWFFLKWQNKKLFSSNRIKEGFNDEVRNFKL